MSEFYDLLGVSRTASDDEIKRAYRKMAMQYHPDRNSEPDAESRFKEITEAYEVLKDPSLRQRYDRYGKAGLGGAGAGAGFHHVDLAEALNIFMRDFGGFAGFESMFGGGAAPQDTRRGQDIRVTVKLTLAEVATGAKRTIKLKALERCDTCEGRGAAPGTSATTCDTCGGKGQVQRATRSMFGQFLSVTACPTCGGEGEVVRSPCEVCRGEGRVRGDRTVTVEVPAGVTDNNYLTLRGQGAAGIRNGPKGDLLVMLEVKEDRRFERQGDDLIVDLALSFSQAALGGTFPVPTATGEIDVDVRGGTQTDSVIRLRGKGLPHLG
ncbi:MAG: molecular chaperone DnaJ, partial [Gemmatimonadales bacterium]